MSGDASILIVGAGPAGLSLAFELARRGIGSRLLEAGGAAGAVWDRMPKRMKLLSPWTQNVLFERRAAGGRYRLLPAREFAAYLRESAAERGFRVESSRRVLRVEKRADTGFETSVDGGASFVSREVVNATGYYSKPWRPELPGLAATSIPQLHFADYQSAAELATRHPRTGRRALVVGKRVSSGQLVEELVEVGFEVALSCRTPLEFARPPWLQAAVFPFYYFVEEIVARRRPHALAASNPPMTSGRVPRWVRSGKVELLAETVGFERDRVRFADGTSASFDVVLFATGFRPALDHLEGLVTLDARGLPPLAGGFESAETPGLYFLGLDQQRTFRSRYLRGIRDDARALAAQLADSLGRSEFLS